MKDEELIDYTEVYKKAVLRWGKMAQVMMLFEELSELQKSVCHYYRNTKESTIDDVAEEIADTEIMCEQVMQIMGISRDDILYHKKRKLVRLKILVGR